MTLSEMQHVVKKAHLTFDDAKHMLGSRALLHGPAGSVLAKTAFGIDDEEIRGAIYYHTTGRVGMTLLEKIVFLADYIEPNRDFPGVEDCGSSQRKTWTKPYLRRMILRFPISSIRKRTFMASLS